MRTRRRRLPTARLRLLVPGAVAAAVAVQVAGLDHVAATSAASSPAAVARVPSPAWTVRSLPPLARGQPSYVAASNDRGHVVGRALVRVSGGILVQRAVLWHGGRVRALGTLPLGGGSDMPNASSAVDVNRRGDVVGTSWVESNDPVVYGTLWRNGTRRRLGGGRTTVAVAVNDRGQVAGFVASGTRSDPRDVHAALWRAGRVQRLGSLPGWPHSEAVDVNERGRVAANAYTADEEYLPSLVPLRERAFLWRAGRRIDVGTLGGQRSWAVALNDRDEVVGWSTTADGGTHGFLWRAGRMTDLGVLPGDRHSEAVAINDRGEVVGISRRPGQTRGFVWRNGRMRDLGTLGGRQTLPTAINDRGQVVGSSTTARGRRRAFVWHDGRMVALGGTGSEAVAINERGTVIGSSGGGPVVWTMRARR